MAAPSPAVKTAAKFGGYEELLQDFSAAPARAPPARFAAKMAVSLFANDVISPLNTIAFQARCYTGVPSEARSCCSSPSGATAGRSARSHCRPFKACSSQACS